MSITTRLARLERAVGPPLTPAERVLARIAQNAGAAAFMTEPEGRAAVGRFRALMRTINGEPKRRRRVLLVEAVQQSPELRAHAEILADCLQRARQRQQAAADRGAPPACPGSPTR